MGQKINPVLKRILQIMQQTEKAARIFDRGQIIERNTEVKIAAGLGISRCSGTK